MKKMIKTITVILTVCLMACIFFGCSEEKSNELVGTWKGTGNEHATITFKNDGSFKEKGISADADMSGTYTIDETNKIVVCNEKEYGLSFKYNYTLDGDNLTLQMDIGYPRTFSK